ncbi:uncharacterized protein EI90DRAFT_1915477 [Cantharellus anzutake]|uniref:uncharacterized protein n=1 Tax=Cantharellus anzutake TaxID=1750568 RepID=UPI001908FD27|nr:uncharacterized protein EI90DRAFT_1915477 [Cantharellus anzutake]KAF8326638.1 hypothetical protein EI90DRAFT_1915477 [Cantharellus anzutake]
MRQAPIDKRSINRGLPRASRCGSLPELPVLHLKSEETGLLDCIVQIRSHLWHILELLSSRAWFTQAFPPLRVTHPPEELRWLNYTKEHHQVLYVDRDLMTNHSSDLSIYAFVFEHSGPINNPTNKNQPAPNISLTEICRASIPSRFVSPQYIIRSHSLVSVPDSRVR